MYKNNLSLIMSRTKHSFKFQGRSVALWKRGKNWSIWMKIDNKDLKQSLGVDTVHEAVRAAKKLVKAALEGKWEKITVTKSGAGNWSKIGEVISRFKDNQQLLKLADSTVNGYIESLELIVSIGLGIPRSQVADRRLNVLNSETINAWKNAKLSEARGNKKKLDSISESINTRLRSARSIFGKKLEKNNIYRGLKIPNLKEFHDASYMEVVSKENYVLPEQSLLNRIWDSVDTLLEEQPRTWFCFKLCAFTGMRRGEVLAARWRWFEMEDEKLFVHIQVEEDFVPKDKDIRRIQLPTDFLTMLRHQADKRGWPNASNDYIVPKGQQGFRGNKPDKIWFNDKEKDRRGFDGLGRFMKAQGWTRRQKAHELRKIFATQINKVTGIDGAKQVLGHSDLRTTERYAAKPEVPAVEYSYGK